MNEFDRQAVLNKRELVHKLLPPSSVVSFLQSHEGAGSSHRCVNVLAQYNPNLVAYVGARNWNKFVCKQDYTSSAHLKFSNIKVPGDKFLTDMKWWLDYKVTITFKDFPLPC